MSSIQSIQQFLTASGAQYRLYDMGRRVLKLSHDQFHKFEQAQIPYPYPLQRHAWFGILFWAPKKTEQHHIWFLKLPLDEQGYISLSARDDFLRRALEELGQALLDQQKTSQSTTSSSQHENPWCFTPREDKMATFHAKAQYALKLAPSQHFNRFTQYLSDPTTYSQWQSLGLQGISDFAVRWNDHKSLLLNALPTLPNDVFIPLMQCLESEAIDQDIAEAIINRCRNASDTTLLAASIRGLSGCPQHTERKAFLSTLLHQSDQYSIEILVAISGRCWDDLNDPTLNLTFLEALSQNDAGQEAFNQVLQDLLFIPKVAVSIREAFRNPKRSEKLAIAIGDFLRDSH